MPLVDLKTVLLARPTWWPWKPAIVTVRQPGFIFFFKYGELSLVYTLRTPLLAFRFNVHVIMYSLKSHTIPSHGAHNRKMVARSTILESSSGSLTNKGNHDDASPTSRMISATQESPDNKKFVTRSNSNRPNSPDKPAEGSTAVWDGRKSQHRNGYVHG